MSKKPGRIKVPKSANPNAVPALPILEVEECLTNGWTRQRVVEVLAKRHGVHIATVYDWVAKVHAKWAEEAEAGRPIRKAQLRCMNLRAYEIAIEDRQPGAAVAAAAAIAKLDGLDEAQKYDHGVTLAPLTPAEEQAALSAFVAQHSTLAK